MRRELVKFILGRRSETSSEVERRRNIYDRRQLSTYIENDRRSGVADRRATLLELIKILSFKYFEERRCGKSDRRKWNTYIRDDRRSGIQDRRSGYWKRQ